ncbi:unnamed protein product [Nesidiocoris tenuis]|uniref:Uncharacterized protein n=1 Tax=Nesidiocoris tenuis TaxID=355587 RepID=A0A6H5G6C5_9HEMI|nr:unnamed protein product [Nesidiocoris tenuis]
MVEIYRRRRGENPMRLAPAPRPDADSWCFYIFHFPSNCFHDFPRNFHGFSARGRFRELLFTRVIRPLPTERRIILVAIQPKFLHKSQKPNSANPAQGSNLGARYSKKNSRECEKRIKKRDKNTTMRNIQDILMWKLEKEIIRLNNEIEQSNINCKDMRNEDFLQFPQEGAGLEKFKANLDFEVAQKTAEFEKLKRLLSDLSVEKQVTQKGITHYQNEIRKLGELNRQTDAEKEARQIESEIEAYKIEIEANSKEVAALQAEFLEAEKKRDLAEIAKLKIDQFQAPSGEIGQLKLEIHRMEFLFHCEFDFDSDCKFDFDFDNEFDFEFDYEFDFDFDNEFDFEFDYEFDSVFEFLFHCEFVFEFEFLVYCEFDFDFDYEFEVWLHSMNLSRSRMSDQTNEKDITQLESNEDKKSLDKLQIEDEERKTIMDPSKNGSDQKGVNGNDGPQTRGPGGEIEKKKKDHGDGEEKADLLVETPCSDKINSPTSPDEKKNADTPSGLRLPPVLSNLKFSVPFFKRSTVSE